MGCSTLYHLAKMGCDDAVLLERAELTSGTTWHSAAQVRALRSTENLTRLIKDSIALYMGLEAETGQSTGWSQSGSLSLATSEDRFTHIKRQAALSRAFGLEAHVVGPKEAAELWPLMRSDDVIGAVYSPGDGRVNPSDLCAALAKGARARGAKIFEHTPVTGFDIQDGRVRGVETAQGRIACDAVVLCGGLWSRAVGALAGVSVPLYACEHFYLLTKPIDGIDGHLPTLGDHDGYLYIRDDVGGLLVGCFEPEGKALPLEALPKDFSFDLLNEDWDHFEPMMLNALHRIPALETAEARTLLNGPESFTPDGSPLMGESPEIGGFFVGCGMNSMGVATSGGAGKALAHWVLEGHPEFDLWPVDIRRFAPFHADEASLRARVPEVLGDHYAIHYPGTEPETARNIRCGPVHERLAENGAAFGQRMGWERADWFDPTGDRSRVLQFGKPAWHDPVAAEHAAARKAVALFDQTSFGKLMVEGADAETALQRLCANDMAVEPGQIVYSGMLNDRGGYESDFTVTRMAADRYLIVTGTAQPIRDRHWILGHLETGERVTVTDVSDDMAVLSLMGPQARDVLSRVTSTNLGNDAFPFYTSQEVAVDGGVIRANRLSYVGELGWELYVPNAIAAAVYDALQAVGADFGLRDAGTYALTSLRLEKAFRAFGHELTTDETPLDAGLGFATKLDGDTPFLGRDALLRQRDAGPKKRLFVFTVDDPDVFLIGNEPVLSNGDVVGQLTSVAYGHTIGRSVALGYMRLHGNTAAKMAGETGYTLDLAGETVPVSVSLRAPYDPTGSRMRN
jgi:glycine cleavage system aminomethyltransferase T/glycine/D-amino acid oxidase-like deaminating enzyme